MLSTRLITIDLTLTWDPSAQVMLVTHLSVVRRCLRVEQATVV